MSYLPIAARIAVDAAAREARSALPNAPVVRHAEPSPAVPRLRRMRSSTAAGLQWAARVVEPAECSPVR